MGLYHIELPGNLPLRGFAPAIVSHLAARILAIEGRSTSDYLLGRGLLLCSTKDMMKALTSIVVASVSTLEVKALDMTSISLG